MYLPVRRVGGQIVRHRGQGRWKACNKEGLGSAKVQLLLVCIMLSSVHLYEVLTNVCLQTFAIMGGLYTAANCISKRIRQKDDGRLQTWRALVVGCTVKAYNYKLANMLQTQQVLHSITSTFHLHAACCCARLRLAFAACCSLEWLCIWLCDRRGAGLGR